MAKKTTPELVVRLTRDEEGGYSVWYRRSRARLGKDSDGRWWDTHIHVDGRSSFIASMCGSAVAILKRAGMALPKGGGPVDYRLVRVVKPRTRKPR